MQSLQQIACPGSHEPGFFYQDKHRPMIEIFKTNVENALQAATLLCLLRRYLPSAEINFDLEDCDSILRVKDEKFCSSNIVKILADNGFECEVLI